MISTILAKFSEILRALNTTSVKRLVIYAMLIYPIIMMIMYKDEIRFAINTSNEKLVKIHDLASAQERCFNLREQWGAEAVMLYIYQPASKNKNYKERIIFSSSKKYSPLESTKQLQLSSRSRILEELKLIGYSVITADSRHNESSLVQAFNLKYMVITPIKDDVTSQIIGEVVWCFNNEDEETFANLNNLVNAGQIFSYDIIQD